LKNLLSQPARIHFSKIELDFGSQAIWNLQFRSGATIKNQKTYWEEMGLNADLTLLAQKVGFLLISENDCNGLVAERALKALSHILKLFIVSQELKPGIAFQKYKKGDWISLIIVSHYRNWEGKVGHGRILKKIEKPLAFGTLSSLLFAFRSWFNFYISGDIHDGPEFLVHYSDIKIFLEKDFDETGQNYNGWKNGKTLGSVNFMVANLLLADALSVLRSKRTEELLAYFHCARKHSDSSSIFEFWTLNVSPQFVDYRRSGNLDKMLVDPRNDRLSNNSLIVFLTELHKKLVDIQPQKVFIKFPWRTYSELIADYTNLIAALYIIFLTVMGKRGNSEILTLRGVDLTNSNSDTGSGATMRPSIRKTNKGFREEQGVTNFIDDAFNTLLHLGYVDKAGTTLPLFSMLHPKAKSFDLPVSLCQSHSYQLLSDYYNGFIERVTSKVDFDVRELQPSITSHQFRHAFAEFALRRFDGNVEELIRQHFCHRYNHWWTKRYTADKLDACYENDLSRKYIRELVPRILSDSIVDPDFVGGMAVFIKREIRDKIKTSDHEGVARYIDNFCSDILTITPHEYGWCLVHRKYSKVAQCADALGVPEPSNTDSSKCNKCANFCASKHSHLAVQTQIAVSHLNFIECNTWKMPILKNASIEALRNAEFLFPELKAVLYGNT
jgi:hypothetical protein